MDEADPLFNSRFPRSNAYDAQWVQTNQMGPNALWLLEWLTESMAIEPGMRVLDLGCGAAMTSIFLAREFGARVRAADLWVPASANHTRIVAAGVEDLVVPIHAEAHALPFAEGFFDAIVSVDAYQYFGTADLYLGYLVGFLKGDGPIGIVTPGLWPEFDGTVPAPLEAFWEWDFYASHGPDWWRTHWEKTGLVQVDVADALDDGWKHWLQFDQATEPHLDGWRKQAAADGIAMHTADRGEHLGFSRVVASRVRPRHALPTSAAEGRRPR